jgi:hypothetical protein
MQLHILCLNACQSLLHLYNASFDFVLTGERLGA